ncbi:MAG: trypsin-like serine protease [Myxococcales bacterium]|nr:trypsin-like serine protease [Myxococcales bacterium]
MKFSGLCLVLISGLTAAPALAGPTQQAPIVGGTSTSVGQYPTTVAIELGGGLCTGTLLTKDWILTAAHCVDPAVLGVSQAQITASTRVHFDTVNLRTTPGIVVTASETIKHPQFNVNNLGMRDIGLIRLSTPVTDRVPVPINLVAGRAPVGIGVTMVGYGVTSRQATQSAGVERVVEQTSVSCAFGGQSDTDLLCFNQTNGKGKCEGDSGGPSFATIAGQQVQIGVTSFGDQNCAQFGADTRTDAETAFLLEHVPELQCGADGVCAASCGQGALPADPDCGCDADHPCGEGHTCFVDVCIVDPFAAGGVGSACTSADECESGTCATTSSEQLCTFACSPGAADACPDGFTCRDVAGGDGVCWPADDGGCCSTGGRGPGASLIGVALVALGLGRRRRRR